MIYKNHEVTRITALRENYYDYIVLIEMSVHSYPIDPNVPENKWYIIIMIMSVASLSGGPSVRQMMLTSAGYGS